MILPLFSRGSRGCQMPGKWRQRRLESRYVVILYVVIIIEYFVNIASLCTYVIIITSTCMSTLWHHCIVYSIRRYYPVIMIMLSCTIVHCHYHVIMYFIIIMSICMSSLSRHHPRCHNHVIMYVIITKSFVVFRQYHVHMYVVIAKSLYISSL